MSYKYEIITCSVNFSHILKETLPFNKKRVDNVVVVTTPTDFATHAVCRENEVEYIETDLFYKDGADFNKGLALNEAFKKLKYNDWVLHLDADTLLTGAYSPILTAENKDLDIEKLYGCMRIEVKDQEEYLKIIKNLALFGDPLGVGNFIDKQEELACGFFQLFNLNSNVAKQLKSSGSYFSPQTQEWIESLGYKDFTKEERPYGNIFPSFPHAGGYDVVFRAMWGENIVGIANPVIHLGTDRNHAGKGNYKF